MPAEAAKGNGQLWPMGAVTRRTGIGEHTLRAWERRFGFPTPVRLASGHRRYSGDQVRHLLTIGRALEAGYRAGDIVPMPLSEIEELLRSAGVSEEPGGVKSAEDVISLVFDASKRFDRDALAASLKSEAIPAAVYYPKCLHEQPIFAACGRAGEFAVAEKAPCEVFSLPMHSFLTGDDQDMVVSAVKSALPTEVA